MHVCSFPGVVWFAGGAHYVSTFRDTDSDTSTPSQAYFLFDDAYVTGYNNWDQVLTVCQNRSYVPYFLINQQNANR